MIEILSHLHQYVPLKECTNIPSNGEVAFKESAIYQHVLLGGDQLSVARTLLQ